MTYRQVVAEKDLRRYLGAQVLSSLGDSALWLTCGIWVRELTGSDSAAGLTYFFFLLPAILAPAAGLLADRLRRKPLLVVLNLLGVAAVLPLLAVRDAADVWLIYSVMAVNGALTMCIGPAQSALLVEISPRELLGTMNGLLRSAQESLRLLAPVAGAGLYLVLGAHVVVLLDAATFLMAAGIIATLSGAGRSRTTSRPEPQRLRTQLGAGVRLLLESRLLRGVVLACAVFMSVAGFSEAARFAIVTEGLSMAPAGVGTVQLAMGVGAVGCGLLAGPLMTRLGSAQALATALAGFALGTGLTATSSFLAVYGGAAMVGGSSALLIVSALTILQNNAPADEQGRAFAGFELLTTVPQVLSIAVGASLLKLVDYRIVLLAITAGTLVACVIAVRAARVVSRPEQEASTDARDPAASSSRTESARAESETADDELGGPATTTGGPRRSHTTTDLPLGKAGVLGGGHQVADGVCPDPAVLRHPARRPEERRHFEEFVRRDVLRRRRTEEIARQSLGG